MSALPLLSDFDLLSNRKRVGRSQDSEPCSQSSCGPAALNRSKVARLFVD
jgi:hypothetical protein